MYIKQTMTSLHKGWQAFGVELDSFCERETNRNKVQQLQTVGMESLTYSSKIYGINRAVCCYCGLVHTITLQEPGLVSSMLRCALNAWFNRLSRTAYRGSNHCRL